MARMNWSRPPTRQPGWSIDRAMGGKPKRHAGKKSNRKRLGFPSESVGICATCKVEYQIGDHIKYNINKVLVHGRGCPKKSPKALPLAG